MLSWYYKDSLDEFISKRPDIFTKVKSTKPSVSEQEIDALFNEANKRFNNTLKKLGE